MKQTNKPLILPSLRTAGTAVWSAVLVALFFAMLAVYSASERYFEARADALKQKPTPIETSYYKTTVPAGWARYALDGDNLLMHKSMTKSLPLVFHVCRRDDANRYRALDTNPALVARTLSKQIAALGAAPSESAVKIVATDVTRVDPGVNAVRALVEAEHNSGIAYIFILDDVQHIICGIWEYGDNEASREMHDMFNHIFDRVDFRAYIRRFERPTVNSAEMTAEEHRRILMECRSEGALCRMFAARADHEKDAILPAIIHFRRMLSLLSSVREESRVVGTPHFDTYLDFLARRQQMVGEWFLLLEKYRSTGDTDGAIKQADFIMRHATLEDEALERRRASRIAAECRAAQANKENK